MDYQALREALAGCGMLDGSDAELDGRIAAVAEGRLEPYDLARIAALAVEHIEPGPAQAGWLGVAAAARELLDENELTGITIASRQLASWAAASELAAVAQITSRAARWTGPGPGPRSTRRPGGAPTMTSPLPTGLRPGCAST